MAFENFELPAWNLAPRFGVVASLAVWWLLIFLWKIILKLKDTEALIADEPERVYWVQIMIHKRLPAPLPFLLQWYVPLFGVLSFFMVYISYEWVSLILQQTKFRDQYPVSSLSPIFGIIGFCLAVVHTVIASHKIRALRMDGRLRPPEKGLHTLQGEPVDTGPVSRTRSTRDEIKVGMAINYSSRNHTQWYLGKVVRVEPFEEVTVELTETVGVPKSKTVAVQPAHRYKKIPWGEIFQRLRKAVEHGDHHVLLKDQKDLEWSTTEKEDILLCIISMPALFTVMAVQSTIRSWDLVYCTDTQNKTRTDDCFGNTVGQVEAFYDMNFDFANLCQYYVVFLFTRLCWKFLRRTVNPKTLAVPDDAVLARLKKLDKKNGNASRAKTVSPEKSRFGSCLLCCRHKAPSRKKSDYSEEEWDNAYEKEMVSLIKKQKRNLKRTTFQGVHWWVAIGCAQLILNSGYSYWANWPGQMQEGQDDSLRTAYEKASGMAKTIFSPFTLLCIYNMIWVCNSPVINESLQGANAKFLGTRLLVLFSQFQLTAFNMFPSIVCDVEGEQIFRKIDVETLTNFKEAICSVANTPAKVKLLHSSLLTIEAMVIIIFNIVAWSWNVDFRETFLDSPEEIGRSLQDELDDRDIEALVNKFTTSTGFKKTLFKKWIDGEPLLKVMSSSGDTDEERAQSYTRPLL